MLKMSIEVALLGAALCPVVKTQAECDISQSHDYFQSFSFQQACVIHLSTIQFYPRVWFECVRLIDINLFLPFLFKSEELSL